MCNAKSHFSGLCQTELDLCVQKIEAHSTLVRHQKAQSRAPVVVKPYFWAENLCVYLFRWVSPPLGFLCGRDCQVHSSHLCIPQCMLLEVCNRSKSKACANILHILVMHESQLVLTKSISECSQIRRIHF